ncbi:hypothetical protein PMIN01_03661 [Paraphaeosphaeria minitans]|uniref:Uncharacterized protein n=1 Tax=Paraphaeosphaeria minitans TaxID=565426 RepID=A0A9P6GN12_9PLEO|nr:hypothetical protein PMIN01_03661 [Paraphaeosphaeria minitans]
MPSEGKTIVLCTNGPLLSFLSVPPPTESTIITSVAIPTATRPEIPPAASPFYYDPYGCNVGECCETRGRSRKRCRSGSPQETAPCKRWAGVWG